MPEKIAVFLRSYFVRGWIVIHDVVVSVRVAIKNTDNAGVDIITRSFILVFYSLLMFSRQMSISYWPRGGRGKVYITPVSWVWGGVCLYLTGHITSLSLRQTRPHPGGLQSYKATANQTRWRSKDQSSPIWRDSLGYNVPTPNIGI